MPKAMAVGSLPTLNEPRAAAEQASRRAEIPLCVSASSEFGCVSLRNALGLTVEEVGAELLVSATKISRLETGARRASLRDVRELCRVYEVNDEAQVAQLMDLARRPESRVGGPGSTSLSYPLSSA